MRSALLTKVDTCPFPSPINVRIGRKIDPSEVKVPGVDVIQPVPRFEVRLPGAGIAVQLFGETDLRFQEPAVDIEIFQTGRIEVFLSPVLGEEVDLGLISL